MLAVLVNPDGSLKHCTCRWNHDYGGNDNILDARQISDLLGVDFYKTFHPVDMTEMMKPEAVDRAFFGGKGQVSMDGGRYTALVGVDLIEDVYSDMSRRDSLSWDFVGAVLDWKAYDLFEVYDYPAMQDMDGDAFDAEMSDYDVTWGDMVAIKDGDFGDVADPKLLTRRRCSIIRDLIEDDFRDGVGLYGTWNDCAIAGMAKAARKYVIEGLFPELNLDVGYGIRDGKAKMVLSADDVKRMYSTKAASDYGDSWSVFNIIRANEDYPNDFEPVCLDAPYGGFDEFDFDDWNEAVEGFAKKVAEVLDTNYGPEDLPGQMTFDFG